MRLLVLILLTTFSFASIYIKVDIKGVDNRALFFKTLKKELKDSGIKVKHFARYTLKVRVKGISNKKHQKVRVKYKFYNQLLPFASGDIDASYSVYGSDAKRYVIKAVAKNMARKIIEQKGYMHRHLDNKEFTLFNKYDFENDKRVDFTTKALYAKEGIVFYIPKNSFYFVSKMPYEKIRSYNINKNRFVKYPEMVTKNSVLVFKSSSGKVGKLRVLRVKNGKIAFEWKWLWKVRGIGVMG